MTRHNTRHNNNNSRKNNIYTRSARHFDAYPICRPILLHLCIMYEVIFSLLRFFVRTIIVAIQVVLRRLYVFNNR